MEVQDLDGNWHNWSLHGHIAKASLTNKSSLHLRARQILKEHYPTMQILEEVPISVRRSETLYLDFYIPLIKKCIEVHGEQHYKFVPFYHTNKLNFLKSRKRDKQKQEWCFLNNIQYIEFPHFDTDKWKDIINEKNS
jgi:hypothetical protein